MGKCKLCGIETLNMCLEELISKKLVKWISIGYDVVGHTLMAKRKKLQRFYTMKLLLES
jgi:predicted restriction endonuclease